MSDQAVGGAPEAPATGGVAEELVDLLVAPARAFASLRRRNAWAHGAIMAALSLVIAVALRGLLEPFIEANMASALRQAAAKGQSLPAGAAGTMATVAWWSFVGSAAFAIPAMALFGGAALWVAARLLSVPLAFGRAAVVATMAAVTVPVGMLVMGVQGLILDPAAIRGITDASLGVARFLDPASAPPALVAMLSRVDLLSLWGGLLEGIGVSVMTGVSRGTGFAVAGVTWLLTTLVTAIPAVLF